MSRKYERALMKRQLTQTNNLLKGNPHSQTLQVRRAQLKRALHQPRASGLRRTLRDTGR